MVKCSDACVKCGLCVKICPFGVLKESEDKVYFDENKKNGCIACMHCIAICPNNALTFSGVESCREKAGSLNTIADYIKQRRSVRNYKDAKIPEPEIEKILQNAKWAPSAKNQHPCKWVVLSDSAKIKALMDIILEHVTETKVSPEVLSEYADGNNIVIGNAPHLLIAYADAKSVNPAADCAIVAASAELMFFEKGFGTCWAGYLSRFINANEKIQTLLKIPEGHKSYACLMLGYPDEKYPVLPQRNSVEITWL